jgi:small-conductance mechanosensitive channel
VRRCGLGVPYVAAEPGPDVLLASFGASGLNLQLQVWLESSAEKSRVIDALNSNLYKALAAAGIEIPYTKADLYVKELPAVRAPAAPLSPAPAPAAPPSPLS